MARLSPLLRFYLQVPHRDSPLQQQQQQWVAGEAEAAPTAEHLSIWMTAGHSRCHSQQSQRCLHWDADDHRNQPWQRPHQQHPQTPWSEWQSAVLWQRTPKPPLQLLCSPRQQQEQPQLPCHYCHYHYRSSAPHPPSCCLWAPQQQLLLKVRVGLQGLERGPEPLPPPLPLPPTPEARDAVPRHSQYTAQDLLPRMAPLLLTLLQLQPQKVLLAMIAAVVTAVAEMNVQKRKLLLQKWKLLWVAAAAAEWKLRRPSPPPASDLAAPGGWQAAW